MMLLCLSNYRNGIQEGLSILVGELMCTRRHLHHQSTHNHGRNTLLGIMQWLSVLVNCLKS